MRKKIDYIKKGQLIANGSVNVVAEYDYFRYRLHTYGDAIVPMYYKTGKNKFAKIDCPTLKNIAKLGQDLDNMLESDIIECRRINHAKWTKNKRLNDKLCKMINFAQVSGNDVLFLTLTFNDDSLQNLNAQVRRKYVAKFLKENSFLYVGNIDFGEEYGREHFHAVVVGQVNCSEWHPYGAIKIQHVKLTAYCGKVLAKYVTKLTNHAIKECAMTKENKRNVLLYQKGFDREYVRLMTLFNKNEC